MKKIISFVLLLAIVLVTFNSCNSNTSYDENSNSSETLSSQQNTTTSEKSPLDTSTSSKKNSTQNKSSSSKKQTASSKPSGIGSGKEQLEETIVTDKPIKEPSNLGKIKELKINSQHTALKSSSYYQYSSLSDNEKTIYNLIVDTIKDSRSIVNFANLAPSSSQVSMVFQKVLADYPQFFYISRVSWFIYGSKGDNIRALILSYSDGEVEDEFDDNINLVKTADRALINQKIEALQSTIDEILSKIPLEGSNVIKEKIIFDYIIKYIRYDKVAAESIGTFTVTPHAFDLYGAAVEKKAVCEGYSKLFQYLCYCVGINSTQILGTAKDENHMWNAVLIENEWYQIDLTWSDIATRYPDYSYFNLTAKNMSKDHIIDSSVFSVPTCNSTKNSFINAFAVSIKNLKKPPENYENSIENMLKTGVKTIYFYFEENESGKISVNSVYQYMKIYVYLLSSQFHTYLLDQGLNIVSPQMERVSDFYVLLLR